VGEKITGKTIAHQKMIRRGDHARKKEPGSG